MSAPTPEKLAELRWLLDTPPQHITIARDDALALLDAAAERDALAAKLDEVRKVAEYYAGLTNVDAGSAILRALDATPETGGES